MANAEVDPNILKFVIESERIAGIKLPKKDHEKRPGTLRHLDCAKIIEAGFNVVNAELINCTLTGRTGDWYRSGVEGALQGIIPEGELVPKLMAELTDEIQHGVFSMLGIASAEECAQFAWNMHVKLICNHAFKEANGRTARMMLNQIRRRLGLPWFIIEYDKSREYFSKLTLYRETTFIPHLHEMEEAA